MSNGRETLLEHVRRQVVKSEWLSLSEQARGTDAVDLLVSHSSLDRSFKLRLAFGPDRAVATFFREDRPDEEWARLLTPYGRSTEERRAQQRFTDELIRLIRSADVAPPVNEADLEEKIASAMSEMGDDAAGAIAAVLSEVLAPQDAATLVERLEAAVAARRMEP